MGNPATRKPMTIKARPAYDGDKQPVVTRLARGLALLDAMQLPEYAPRVEPPATDKQRKANDAVAGACLSYATSTYPGMGFLGFPFLSELSQISEYRVISDRLAQEMTRKWIRFRSTGEEDKSEQIKELTAEDTRLQTQARFYDAMLYGGLFGRGQLFLDMGTVSDNELKTPLNLDEHKVKKGSFQGIRAIEPMWSYAYSYNASNPLSSTFYAPESWYVMTREVHSTRLLTLNPYPVPDILRPIYAFGGISLSQLAMPTVENFLRMRTSVSNIVLNYSLRGIKTNLVGLLEGGVDSLNSIQKRIQIFTDQARNDGALILDKEMEDFFQHTTALTNLDKLLDQARDNMCAVANIPRMVLFGLSPEGMNATAAGELEVFEQYVAGMQETVFRHQLDRVVKLMMLSLWGKIDDGITYDFVPLRELTEKDESEIRLRNAQADSIYKNILAVASDEVRAKLARDPSSGYDNLEVGREVVPAANPGMLPTGAQANLPGGA